MRKSVNDNFLFLVFFLSVALTFSAQAALADDGAGQMPPLRNTREAVEDGAGVSVRGYADLAGTWNPRGIGIVGGVDYRNAYRYSEQYKTVSAYWQSGLGVGVNPAYLQPSIIFEWMPVLPLTVRASYDGYYYYGTNGGLLSFSSARDPFGDSVRDEREGTEESGFGQRIMLQPTMRIKVGRIILRNQTDYAYYRFPGKGPYFLELEYDTLLKDRDHLFANRTQVLADIGTSKGAAFAGPFFEVVRADAAHLDRKRIGLTGYTERGPKFEFFRETHYFAQAGYNLEDPNRGHEFFLLIGIGGTFGL